jgi:ABC-type glycerol-3-phosphate transport system substrate-binding protein
MAGKRIMIFILTSFLFLMCFSCDNLKLEKSKDNYSKVTKNEQVEEGARLKLWGPKAQYQPAVDEFKNIFPGVEVEIEEINIKGVDLNQFLLSRIASNQTVDLCALYDANYSPFYEKDIFMSIDKLIKKDKVDEWPWIHEDVLEGLKYNGKIYALPIGVLIYGLWYNVELVKRFGVDKLIPKSFDDPKYKEWTWETYIKLLKKCTVDEDGDGTIDIYGTDDSLTWGLTDWLASAGIYSKMIKAGRLYSNYPLVDTFALETIQFYVDLKVKEKVNPPEGMDTNAVGINIENEKVVIRRMGSWAYEYFKNRTNPERIRAGKDEIKFAFAPYPHKEGKEEVYRSFGFTQIGPRIFANTKYPKAAWELVKIIHSPETEDKLYNITQGGFLPNFTTTTDALNRMKNEIGKESTKMLIQLSEHLNKEAKGAYELLPIEYEKQYEKGRSPLEQFNLLIPNVNSGLVKVQDVFPSIAKEDYQGYVEGWEKFDKR